MPRIRDGSYRPSLLDPRRRTERALLAVVEEAYVSGVSTRRVDDLVRAMGIDGISKSEVSRICAALDAEVDRFRSRPLGQLRLSVSVARRVVPQGARVAGSCPCPASSRSAWGPTASAGCSVSSSAPATTRAVPGPRSSGASSERGLHGIRLVISDDHAGLVQAVGEQFLGSGWQRCRFQFTRNAQDLVPRTSRSMAPSAIRSVFEQPDGVSAREQLDRVIDGMAKPYPRVAALLADADADLLSHFAFPASYGSRIRSTNPLERLNKEIKRRTGVLGIFPYGASVTRLVGMILAEQDDEWQDGRRYVLPETRGAIDAIAIEEVGQPLLLAS